MTYIEYFSHKPNAVDLYKLFILHNWNFIHVQLLIYFSLLAWQWLSASINITIIYISYKGIIKYVLFCDCLIPFSIMLSNSSVTAWQDFLLFYGWIIFHCKYITHFSFLLFYVAFSFFLCPSPPSTLSFIPPSLLSPFLLSFLTSLSTFKIYPPSTFKVHIIDITIVTRLSLIRYPELNHLV